MVLAAIQEKILDICRRNLAPQGVGLRKPITRFLGRYMKTMARENITVYHSRELPERTRRQGFRKGARLAGIAREKRDGAKPIRPSPRAGAGRAPE